MKQNQTISQTLIEQQKAEGFSFLYTVDPQHEAQYQEEERRGLVFYVPVALTGRLSLGEIITKHAQKLKVQPDRLKVVEDVYRYDDVDSYCAEALKRRAALFVRTEDLEGVLQRNPWYRVFQK